MCYSIRLYFYWKKKKKGINLIDKQTIAPRLCIYFSPDFVNIGEYAKKKECNNKVGVYKYFELSNKHNANKYNMHLWDFIGFVNEKPIKDCTYREFKKIYGKHVVYHYLKSKP